MNWVDYSLELLDRLLKDWDLIHASLAAGAEPGSLTSIAMGTGDAHRRGRTVAILEFSAGFKLVYKPPPSARAFVPNGTICALNQSSDLLPLRINQVDWRLVTRHQATIGVRGRGAKPA
jgi:lantibiotic modifying enzyme